MDTKTKGKKRMFSCFLSCFCGSTPVSDDRQKDQHRSSKKKAVLLKHATTAESVDDGSIVSEMKTPVRQTPSEKTIQRAKKRSSDSGTEGWLVLLAMAFVTMILDARLLAVLWLSAWFYFSPFLSKNLQRNKCSAGRLGMENYKEKVVLQGLLEKNGRSTILYNCWQHKG